MDIEAIKGLAKELMVSFKEAELTKFSLKCDEFKLELGKEINVMSMPNASCIEVDDNRLKEMSEALSTLQVAHTEPSSESQSNVEQNAQKVVGTKVIKAPLVGTFYSAEGPNSKPFVEIGSYVHKGDVVCIVEAMKLMNEVEAEEEGEVVEILVNNEDMVEYNQPLIVLR